MHFAKSIFMLLAVVCLTAVAPVAAQMTCTFDYCECINETVAPTADCQCPYADCIQKKNEQQSGDDVKVEGLDKLRAQAKADLNPSNLTSVPQAVGRFISFFVGFTGTATLVFYIYAGFLWMTAAGNADRVSTAKNIMMWTTFGVIAIFSSYLMVDFILKKVL